MAIWEKDGRFYVDGSDQSFSRIEEARVVNEQVKSGTEFGQGQKAVKQVAEDPSMLAAVAEEASGAVPSLIATGATMAVPQLRAAGAVPAVARAGVQGIAEYVKQLEQGGETPVQSGLQAAGASLGIEGVLGTAGAVVKNVIGKAPGVAERLAGSQIPALKTIGQKFGVTPDQGAVRAAYQAFEQLGQNMPQGVPLTVSGPKLLEVTQELSKRVIGKQQPQLVKEISSLGSSNTVVKSFKDVDKLMHNLNRTLEGASPEERRLIYQLKDSIWKDIDNAQVPAAQKAAYRTAVQTARTNFAKQELDNLVGESVTGRVGQMSGVPVPKTKGLLESLDALAEDARWVKDIGGAKKVEQIREFVRQIHVKTARGSNEGSAVVLGGLGGLIGSSVAGAPGAAIGAASAVASPGIISRLAEKPKLAKMFLYLIDSERAPLPRQVATGLFNAIVSASGVND